MKPWTPCIHSLPGGAVPVAPPIQVELLDDDLEALWWAHLLAALGGLRAVYYRLGDEGQVYRTGKVQERALGAVKKLYLSMAEGINRGALRAAHARIGAWDWHQDPISLEAGWWAQAAYCAHSLAAGYAFHGGLDDARALMAADVLRAIRERVACALPEHIAFELLEVATATNWSPSEVAQAMAVMAGTSPAPDSPALTLDMS